MSEESYIKLTKEAMSKAYVPYSNYPVGALIITDKGNQYTGCNVENASYPLGNCAEASAIASMVMGGENKINKIYHLMASKIEFIYRNYYLNHSGRSISNEPGSELCSNHQPTH